MQIKSIYLISSTRQISIFLIFTAYISFQFYTYMKINSFSIKLHYEIIRKLLSFIDLCIDTGPL